MLVEGGFEDRTVEKSIFIDETWQLIGASSNRLAAEFVLEIFKIIRGYGGSAICATQDLNDFFALEDGKYGKGIINNSKTKIVLNLEDEEAMRVQSILHLSEAETMAVTHFERGNGLISTNNNNVTVEFKASELEKELITTDRLELKKILEKEKQWKRVLTDATGWNNPKNCELWRSEWNKQNLHSLIGHDTRELGKFHIITNQDTNFSTILSQNA